MPTCGCYKLILYLKTYHHVYHANAVFIFIHIYLHIYLYKLYIYTYFYVYSFSRNPDSLTLPGDKWGLPPCQVGTSASQQGDYFQVFVFQKDDLAQIYIRKKNKKARRFSEKKTAGFSKNRTWKTPHPKRE